MLRMPEVVLFPTGWAAGFGTITGLVRPYDHVVMDELAHQCLQQGAYTATRNVHRHPHLSNDVLEKQLHSIRDQDAKAGILVVTESLFSMDADVPDIRALQDLCDENDAILLLDIAHDFGAMGPSGTGALGMQGMLGEVDLVMGSFSKTFASNGGFVAVNSPSVKQYLKYYSGAHAFSNALSPVQCATVDSALSIVRSEEGEQLRDHLEKVVLTMRTRFESHGIPCLGIPSPIVPVQVEDKAVAWLAGKQIAESGVLANLVEYPAVAAGSARFRLQAMATHTTDQACTAADIIANALEAAQERIAQNDRLTEHAS
jgi:7-keto-8-aminopelargonate synthetase-like enzyme